MALAAGAFQANAAVKSYWDQASGRWIKFDTQTKRIIPTPHSGGTTGTASDSAYSYSPIKRKTIDYNGPFGPDTIVINTTERRLYYVFAPGKALKYGVGVGREGFQWAGVNRITRKAEWPGWTPPPEMIVREKQNGRILPAHMDGGVDNPLGARALYIGDTMYRIHGSNEPWTIGHAVSSGCIRMTNDDVTHLYDQVKIGTRVVVLRGDETPTQLAALAHPPPEKKAPITAEARAKDDGLMSIGVVAPGAVPADKPDTTPTASVAPTEATTAAVAGPPEARTKDDAVTAALPIVVPTDPAIATPQEARAKDDEMTGATPPEVDNSAAANSAALPGQSVPN